MKTNLINELKFEAGQGVTTQKYKHNLTHQKFLISENKASIKKGDYSIIEFPELFFAGENEVNYLISFLSSEIKQFLGEVNTKTKILIVGLGNRNIAADSLGAQAVKNIFVTNHVHALPPFKKFPKVFAFCPSVFGLTGIESSQMIKAVVNEINPSRVIVIDTLCASEFSRLGTSFQLNNAGIVPGSGVNNARKLIDKLLVGVPVVAMGVPIVAYAYNTAVTVKDVEELVSKCAYVLGGAINHAMLGLTLKQQQEMRKNYFNKY